MNNSSIFLSYCLAFFFHLEISWSLVMFYILLVSGQGLKLGAFHFHPKAYGHKHFHLGLDPWMLYSQKYTTSASFEHFFISSEEVLLYNMVMRLGIRPPWRWLQTSLFSRVLPGWHVVVPLWIQKTNVKWVNQFVIIFAQANLGVKCYIVNKSSFQKRKKWIFES